MFKKIRLINFRGFIEPRKFFNNEKFPDYGINHVKLFPLFVSGGEDIDLVFFRKTNITLHLLILNSRFCRTTAHCRELLENHLEVLTKDIAIGDTCRQVANYGLP